MADSKTSDGARERRRFSPTIGLAGFGVLLGWHFIILYYPLPMTDGAMTTESFLARQVVLNASLCLFFALCGRLFAKLPQRDAVKSHAIAYAAIAVGTVGSVALVAGAALGIALTVVAVALIGASEAALMLLWLRFYSETSENYSGQSLGASAVIAALTCFFTYHLTYEVSVVVLVALPGVSGALLITMTRDIPLRKNDTAGSGIPDWDAARRPYLRVTAQLMAMSLFFGVVQGCYSPADTLLPMAEPLAILGAALAGLVIFALYGRSKLLPNLAPVLNASSLLFLGGMMLLPFQGGLLSQLAAFLIMTGFIFYFVLALIFIIDLVRTFDLNLTVVLGANQALEYAMFAVGIVAGNLLWSAFGDEVLLPFIVSYAAIFALVAMTLLFATERPPWQADYYKPNLADEGAASCAEASAAEPYVEEVDVLAIVGQRSCLTPREMEVFALLSKGRNAEFIQNALVISNHTAKTHIYNIYRKMGIHSLQELLDLLDAEEAAHAPTRESQPSGTSA